MSDDSVILDLERTLARGGFSEVLALVEELRAAGVMNPALDKLAADATRRQALLERSRQTQTEVRQFKCPGCGSILGAVSSSSQAIVCAQCGQGVNLRSDELELIARFPKPAKPRYTAFLRMGQKGKLNNVSCEVIGRIHYSASTEEWDSEDSRYTRESWSWEEVCLLTERREFWYLIADQEGFYLAKPYNPDVVISIPDKPNFLTLKSGASRRVDERGIAQATSFEGEFSWLPQPNEEKTFAECSSGGLTYSVEWRGTGSGEAKEIEFFESVAIQERSLLVSFNCLEELAEIDDRQARKRSCLAWAAAFAGLSLVLLFTALIIGTIQGQRVYEYDFPDISLISKDGNVVGPFNLAESGSVYRMSLRAQLSDNSQAWAGVELLDAEQDAINVLEGDLWRESGSDSDGAWSESDLSSEKLFKLETPGVYYLRVFGEPGVNFRSGSVQVTVHHRPGLTRHFFVGAAISALAAVLCVFAGMSSARSSFGAEIPRVANLLFGSACFCSL